MLALPQPFPTHSYTFGGAQLQVVGLKQYEDDVPRPEFDVEDRNSLKSRFSTNARARGTAAYL